MLTRLLEKFFPESSITRFWQNKKLRALFLLVLWTIFIIFIVYGYILPYQEKMQGIYVNDMNIYSQSTLKMVKYKV